MFINLGFLFGKLSNIGNNIIKLRTSFADEPLWWGFRGEGGFHMLKHDGNCSTSLATLA